MSSPYFWSAWPKRERTILFWCLGLLLLVSLLSAIALILGEENALRWLVFSKMETVQAPLFSVQSGTFRLSADGENFVIEEFFEGSTMDFKVAYVYLYLGFLGLLFTLLLTLITFLSRLAYILSSATFIFILVNFRFEQLQLFGWINNYPLLIMIVLLIGPGYYLHAINKSLSFTKRLGVTMASVVAAGLLIAVSAEVSQPFYYLAVYGYTAPLILAVLFIFMVGHEVMYLILFITTQGKPQYSKNKVVHFVLFGLLYLANVVLIYLRNAELIDWELVYLNEFFLLFISIGVGLFGFRQRETYYQNLLPFQPFGALFYLIMASICLVTIGFHVAMVNDPTIEVLEDAIVFSQIGFGGFFLIYTLANHINLLLKNQQVYKIVYQEENFPYVSANLGGLVVIVAFYLLSGQAALSQGIAGYFNGLGDLHLKTDQGFLAQQYYQQGALYSTNHRSNYMLAKIALSQDQPIDAIEHYKASLLKNATPYAYVNLANLYYGDFRFFDGLFALREGTKAFPNSDAIYNNLGLLFKRTAIKDSANFYLSQGNHSALGREVTHINMAGLLADGRILPDQDSLEEVYATTKITAVKNNILALSNNTGKWLSTEFEPDLLNDSALNSYTFSYLYNLGYSRLFHQELQLPLEPYADHPANLSHRQYLILLKALDDFSQYEVTSAFRTLDELQADYADKRGYFFQLLGLLSLHHEAPRLASDFFTRSRQNRQERSHQYQAIALMEAGLYQEAVTSWQELPDNEVDTSTRRDIVKILSSSLSDMFEEANDQVLFQQLRYHQSSMDSTTIRLLTNRFKDPDYKAFALGTIVVNALRKDDYGFARRMLDQLNQLTLTQELAERERQRANFFFELSAPDWATLNTELLPPKLLGYADQLEDYSRVIPAAVRGDSVSQAPLYALGMRNPFFEELVIKISGDLNRLDEPVKAYDVLNNAIEINPYSVRLLKAYTRQAALMNLERFAKAGIERLEDLVEPEVIRMLEDEVELLLENATEVDWEV